MCKCLTGLPSACLERAKEFRTRLGFLLQKPDLKHELGNRCKAGRKSKCGHSLDDVLGWRESFDQLLNSKDGLAAFQAFLKTEFSEENIEFWMACEEYKATHSTTKLLAKADRIFQEFIQTEAPKEVNIDHETKEITRQHLPYGAPSCFDLAQAKARTLMEKDSYPRFLKSSLYRDLLERVSRHSSAKHSHT
ncbi:regulator of G-protein signaling 16 [Rhinatrema bivittatum]|uniref:regulator of G-protein signaling 16 n=1 Tax=Rhinatrema bivittatum TaxID=194408 RepID=UPI001126A7ED|nr:regulator of G-protein signaling 16 [Rhinatrema bivittatum]